MGWILILWGTCFLPSLLFIDPLNVIEYIMTCVARTVVCRAIITFEFWNIAEKMVNNESRPGLQRVMFGR